MKNDRIPAAVDWRNGMVLAPAHFLQADGRAASLAHLAALASEPWPWGFTHAAIDQTALAAAQLRLDCEGVFPNGVPFSRVELTRSLPDVEDGDRWNYHVSLTDDGAVSLSAGDDAPADTVLPIARLAYRSGVWNELSDWSPPAYLLGPDHPMRVDMAHQLGTLATLAAGFMASLKLPRSDNRPAAQMLGQVAAALVQGVGVMEALLASPSVSPGRLGMEALRLALGVRAAVGDFERLDATWDPVDQRGSMRRLLYAAESAASGIGLPFRANPFRPAEAGETLLVEGIPSEALLLAIEASRPGDLIAARAWFEGAALAAPGRIQEAFSLRVAGCPRFSVEHDPRTGVSSGPLLALYQVEHDATWRDDGEALALGAKVPPPLNTSFSILVPEVVGPGRSSASTAESNAVRNGAFAGWAGALPSGER